MSLPPPPGAEGGVFYLHKTEEIGASIEDVWNVLTDLPRYHEWWVVLMPCSKYVLNTHVSETQSV